MTCRRGHGRWIAGWEGIFQRVVQHAFVFTVGSAARLWMQLHLDPATAALIKGFEGLDHIAHGFYLSEDLAWINPAAQREFDKLGNIFAVVAVAHVDGEIFIRRQTDGKGIGVLGVNADDAQGAGFGQAFDGPFQCLTRAVAGLPVFIGPLLLLTVAVTMLGINTNGVDGAVHANTFSKSQQCFYRFFLIKIDYFGSLLARHAQAVSMFINGKHPGSAQQKSAGDSKLTHGAAAKYGNRVTAGDLREFSAEVAGREDVR